MSKEESPEQGKDESDEAFFQRWKKHVKSGGDSKRARQAVWLKDGIGRDVEISCMRSPKVHGKVKAIDLRFGRVMVENDSEVIELNMSDIAQVRYPK